MSSSSLASIRRRPCDLRLDGDWEQCTAAVSSVSAVDRLLADIAFQRQREQRQRVEGRSRRRAQRCCEAEGRQMTSKCKLDRFTRFIVPIHISLYYIIFQLILLELIWIDDRYCCAKYNTKDKKKKKPYDYKISCRLGYGRSRSGNLSFINVIMINTLIL